MEYRHYPYDILFNNGGCNRMSILCYLTLATRIKLAEERRKEKQDKMKTETKEIIVNNNGETN